MEDGVSDINWTAEGRKSFCLHSPPQLPPRNPQRKHRQKY
jgi:hypothetical protein